jgi:hypothetical protein
MWFLKFAGIVLLAFHLGCLRASQTKKEYSVEEQSTTEEESALPLALGTLDRTFKDIEHEMSRMMMRPLSHLHRLHHPHHLRHEDLPRITKKTKGDHEIEYAGKATKHDVNLVRKDVGEGGNYYSSQQVHYHSSRPEDITKVIEQVGNKKVQEKLLNQHQLAIEHHKTEEVKQIEPKKPEPNVEDADS